MASLVIEKPTKQLPVGLDETKNFLRVDIDDDDDLINMLIGAATEACEAFTMRSFVQKGFKQTLDSFPYFTDTTMSQMAYPPSYYSLPRYSTTLWNYSQMIKVFRPPLVSVDRITYLSSTDSQYHDMLPVPLPWYPDTAYKTGNQVADGNGNVQQCTSPGTSLADPPTWSAVINGATQETNGPAWQTIGPIKNGEFGSFIVDTFQEPGRIFPGPPGQFWPAVLYVPNAVQIHFTAGFSADASGVPSAIKTALMQLVSHWYENRETVAGSSQELPYHVKMLLWSWRVLDFQPTRG